MSNEGEKGQTNSSYRDLCTLCCRGHRTHFSLALAFILVRSLNAYDDLKGTENKKNEIQQFHLE